MGACLCGACLFVLAQTWRVFGDHHGVWVGGGGTKDVVNQSAYLAPEFTGKPYGWNDLDMLETGECMSGGGGPVA